MSLETKLLSEQSTTGGEQLLPAWSVLAVLCGVAFTSNVIISLILPILPQHYEQIGVSQIWCGVVFSGFPVAMLVFSPLAVLAMSRFGRIPVLFLGLVVQGVTTLTFGCADLLTGGPGACPGAALAVYTLSRFLCGAGGACANNAIFSVAADRFPAALAKVMGLNEVTIGAGFTLGPLIGMVLYLRCGFSTCFLVAGMTILVFSPFTLALWQPRPAESSDAPLPTEAGGLLEVLRPGLLVPAGSLLLGTGVFGVVQPILSLYLRDAVGATPGMIGVVFAVFSLAYCAAGPLMGALADRVGAPQVCCAGGFASGLIMALFLGPEAEIFPKGSLARLAYEMAALVLLGISQAATLIPSLPAMKAGVPADLPNSTDRVVAWFNMFMQLGLAVSPLVGTALSGLLGFEWTTAISGLGIAAYGAAAVVYAFSPARRAFNHELKLRSPLHLVTGVTLSPFSSPKAGRALSLDSPRLLALQEPPPP